MTALAGAAGPIPHFEHQRWCESALAAQEAYGRGAPRIEKFDGVVLGIYPFALLPEDRLGLEPQCNERLAFVADARIDNRSELRAALGIASSTEQSDPQLFFTAWLRWGASALDRVVGDFAVAAYDRTTHELLLARDPTGQRPLFYRQDGASFAFASMPSGLLVDHPLQHDLPRLAQLLSGGGGLNDQTCFAGIRRVLPGHLLRFRGGQLTSSRYWRPSLVEFDEYSPDRFVDEARDLLDRIVEQRMRGAGETIATHLSSGLDSSAVTATAARIRSQSRIVALTSAPAPGAEIFGPHDRPNDESAVAAETTAFAHIDHQVIRSTDPLLAVLRGHTRAYQEPVRNVVNMGWWKDINHAAQAAGASVLLTGELGNSSLNAGELGILSQFIRQGRLLKWSKEAVAALRRTDISWRGVMISSFGPWVPSGIQMLLDRLHDAAPSWSAGFFRGELLAKGDGGAIPESANMTKRRYFVSTAVDYGPLRKGCLAESHVDQRDPLSDRRLLEFGFRLPPDAFLQNGIYSPLFRSVLSDRLPAAVLGVRSRGFQGGDWPLRLQRSNGEELVEEIAPSSAVQQLLNLDALRRAIASWPTMTASSYTDFVFARDLTAALAAGVFIRDTERYPEQLGR